MRIIAAFLVLFGLCVSVGAWPRHGAPTGGGAVAPGLVLGTYGSTTASGWTTIGPSNGTLASGAFTNIIYVSDSMGSDSRDGSTPTFVDDGNTAQFELSAQQNLFANDVYQAPNTTQFTVAVTNSFAISGSAVTLAQMKNRTGTPNASGTLTCVGSCSGPMTMAYTSATLGIHGPVKTLVKAVGGGGPGAFDPDNTALPLLNNGDGTGLGTRGTWRTTGSIASSFALRSGKPDWVLLRMGDTWTGQAFETEFIGGSSNNFTKAGFSEQEPMVISAYDEAVTVTTPNVGSGTRARPIVLVPTGSATFAGGKPAGSVHLFAGRAGIRLQSGSSFIAIMGIDFQQPQKNPSDPAYVGQVNLTDVSAVDVAGGMTGLLVEDVHSSWGMDGVSVGDQSGNFDIVIRRNQIDHCYAVGAGHPIGASIHNVGTSGGALAGYSFEENVIDLCGYPDPTGMFAFGDSRSRNAYFQGNTAFGNRRGNTSTRSGSESFQFRSGGDIDNNFTYNGLGLDVGHKEGEPTLTSSTVVHNNVTVLPITPFGGGPHPTGLNFANSNNVTASNNLIAHVNDGSALFAATDNYDGGINALTTSNAGTGGAPGNYGCIGGTDFTGGHGTNAGTFNLVVGAGGSITGDPTLQEPNGNEFFAIGDVLTPVANYPSLQTSGTTITAANSGATVGTYGTPFGICPDDPAAALPGFAGGIALTNFSGSMAGSEARATFVVDNWSSITRFMDSGSGLYFAQANANNAFVDFGGSGAHSLNVGSKILVSGVTPSAYNGTWTVTGINQPNGTAIWSLGTMTDPGPVTVLGSFTGYTIIQTGKNYVAGDVLTASFGGGTGLRITVNSVAHLSGWTETVSRILSAGTHALTFTGNTVFNWIGVGPPSVGDDGGTHDSPSPGGAGTGAANIWTPNTICPTAQFTGVITGTNTLTTSALVQGTIAIGQSLAGPGVSPSTTITGGSGTSWTVSPNQTAPSATMYSYTCAPTTVFSAPYRTVQTYAASLGLTASIDGYMTAALANAKWNWTQNLTAAALNHYIRQGYGMTP